LRVGRNGPLLRENLREGAEHRSVANHAKVKLFSEAP
jgi:hypothetical protein